MTKLTIHYNNTQGSTGTAHPRYYVGIDPDVDKSGLVVIDKKMRRVTHAEALDFPGVLVYLTLLKQEHVQELMAVLVVLEDSDISVNWHYNSHDSKGVCAAKGRSVGMCHATARHLRECCENIGLPVMMQQPLRKFWKGKDGKISHEEAACFMPGLPTKTNQEVRDAALLAWEVAGLPIRIQPKTK